MVESYLVFTLDYKKHRGMPLKVFIFQGGYELIERDNSVANPYESPISIIIFL
jgi:hypothetical protein